MTRPAEFAGYHGLKMYILTTVKKPIHERPTIGEVQGRIYDTYRVEKAGKRQLYFVPKSGPNLESGL